MFRLIMKYQKARAAATMPATPPTTPPTIAPVLFDAGLGVGEAAEVDLADCADVADAIAVEDDDVVVETNLPSWRKTPLRWLQHVCPGCWSMLPQQRLLSPHVVRGAVALA